MIFGCVKTSTNFSERDAVNDRLNSLDSLLKNKNYYDSIGNVKSDIKIALSIIESIENDSIRCTYLLKISTKTVNSSDSIFFHEVNGKLLKLSTQMGNDLASGEAFWNFAAYYIRKEHYSQAYEFYYKAFLLFEEVSNDYYKARMLDNMSFILARFKDYQGSERLIFSAIEIFKSQNKNLYLYRCYKRLGLIYNQLDEYEKSISYHHKSYDYLKNTKSLKKQTEGYLNNISLVYQKMGNYQGAISNLNQALENKGIQVSNPRLYAKILDNRAYNYLLMGSSRNLLRDFNLAFSIRDSVGDKSGMVISHLHLADYYSMENDTVSALVEANSAHKLANEISNNRDLLYSLRLLSKLDKKNSNKYWLIYDKINDSLLTYERKERDKISRIRFETDEITERAEVLSLRNRWIITTGTSLIFVILLFFYLSRQRSKNKELVFLNEQEKANGEIYKLMFDKEVDVAKSRKEERNRISEELHDGILGRLFGTRLNMGFMDVKENSIDDFKTYLNELQKIEIDIRSMSHDMKRGGSEFESDFKSLVESTFANQCSLVNLTFEFRSDDSLEWNSVNNLFKVDIFRIIQESINNIIKHANARKVYIEFKLNNEKLIVLIQDNGIGFDGKIKDSGIGILNMKDRIQKYNGILEFVSNQTNGTIVKLTVDINKLRNDNNE